MKTIPNTDRLNLRLRNGIWHVRKQHQGKRIERCLGTADADVAKERAVHVVNAFCQPFVQEAWAQEVKLGLTPTRGWLWQLWQLGRRRRADSTLTLAELEMIGLRSGGKCEVSGIPFARERGSNPYQASIDRIDGTRPYTVDNARLVCLIVNFCMQRWGREAFDALAIAMATRYMERLEANLRGELAGHGKQPDTKLMP